MVLEKPCRVFCCYARKDQEFLCDLNIHLKSLEREGLISVEADIDISPGTEWEPTLHDFLSKAHIILLLISPDFIASDYCFDKEMRQAIARHEQGTARVVPVILRPASWHRMPFGKLQALPKDATPISLSQNRDTAFLSVTKGIRRVVQELTTNLCANTQMEESRWLPAKEDPSPDSDQERSSMDTSEKSSEVNINGPVSGRQDIGKVTGGQVIGVQHNTTYVGEKKDGIRALEKGAKALWNGDYSSAKKELRVAVEEIDRENQPQDAAKANYLFALALLTGQLPRLQGRAVMQAIEAAMNNAITLCPSCASYYRIFACIKKNSFERKGYDILEYQGASLPRCADDDEKEAYFRQCQPSLQI